MSDSFRTALYAKLNGDAVLTAMLATTTSIFHRRAPLDAGFPYIILAEQSNQAVWAFGGPPIEDRLWLVKGVDRKASASLVEDIDKRIRVVLQDPVIALGDGTLLYMRWESGVDYGEAAGQVTEDPSYTVHHKGALYRTIINRT